MAKSSKKYYPYRRKVRWSSNIMELVKLDENVNQAGYFYTTVDLCSNPAQAVNTVSQEYTVKNFEIQIKSESGSNPSNFQQITYYIMYVPQGMQVDLNYAKNHPEYIMAWRFVGGAEPATDYYKNPISVKTRLSRRLNTGDKIVLFIRYEHYSTANDTILHNGICRWWTKAN